MVVPAGHASGLCHSLNYAGHLIGERIIYPPLPPDHWGMNFDGMTGR